MRKLVLLLAMIPAVNAFAYNDYGDDGIMALGGFTLFLALVSLAVSIIVLVRWWKMTNHVKGIYSEVTLHCNDLTYLLAIGEREKAEKAALVMIVDRIYPVAKSADMKPSAKVRIMDQQIAFILPKLQRMGLRLPDYVTSGQKFYDFVMALNAPAPKVEAPAEGSTDAE